MAGRRRWGLLRRGALHLLFLRTPLAAIIDFIARKRTDECAGSRADQSAFALFTGLVPDDGSGTRTERAAENGAILRRRGLAAGEGQRADRKDGYH